MSDDQTAVPDVPQPRKPMSPTVRWIIVGAGVLLLLAIVALSGSIRTNQVRKDTVLQGFNALCFATKDEVLRKDRDRLRLLAIGIAEQGDYSAVSFTDETGTVLATTDERLLGKQLDYLKKPPLAAKFAQEQNQEVVYRAVTLGSNNVIGGLAVRLQP